MNILSCFDGMSCGQIALNRIGVTPDVYYAAEIDKHAIKVAQRNYPDTVQLGSVLDWQTWSIEWASIDLVTGGFPCQAWSVAGKGLGDKDPRGALFWTFLDIIKNVMVHNPNAKFLMENVKMKKEFEKYITHHTEQALGIVHKTLINSALVSAQSRQRYYWTNFSVTQPADKGVILADILEYGIVDREKSYCIDAHYANGKNLKSYFEYGRRQLVFSDDVCSGAIKGRYIVDGKRQNHKMKTAGLTEQRLEVRSDGKTNTLTTVQKDNVVVSSDLHYRKLTPVECERLQTVPDNFTACVSNTQRYKMLGNGWTVDVIAHILRQM
jgi:DNA (cytosine-5)-methyltransferase 1/DNA (cytosine-5)-methyltransferase 3A